MQQPRQRFTTLSLFLDCVDHKILLHNLKVYGVWGIDHTRFQSYLSNRVQYVSINGVISGILSVESGISKGSILGLLLFLIYINDFPNRSKFFKYNLFFDDSTLSLKYGNIPMDVHANVINCELMKVNHWLLLNKIKVNVNKSKFWVFFYKKKTLPSFSSTRSRNN